MSRNNRKLIRLPASANNYKPISIDLSRQTNTSIPQQINFKGKLKEYDGAAMFFTTEKQQETIINFFLDSLK